MKRRRYALLVTPMPSFRMRDCRVDSFRPRRAAAPSGLATTQLVFWRLARICSRSASSSAVGVLPAGTAGTKPTKTARRGNPLTSAGYANRNQFPQAWREQQAQIVASSPASLAIENSIPPALSLCPPPVGPLPIGWVSPLANCRKSGMRRSHSGSSGSIGTCRR